jgi:hypothetical protein
MPGSEIDDIFAGKSGERKTDKPIEQSVPKKKKKKIKRPSDALQPQETILHSKRKDKSELITVNEDSNGKKRKRQAPEEIVDPSAPVKRRKTEEPSAKLTSKKPLKGDDVQKFKDSRGSSGR